MCLPPHARAAIDTARQDLDRGVEWFSWAALVALWAILLPGWWPLLAVVLAIVLTCICYSRLLGLAQTFALLFRSAYDLYRFDLYAQLRLCPPASPFLEWNAARTQDSPINAVMFSLPPDSRQTFLHAPSKDESPEDEPPEAESV